MKPFYCWAPATVSATRCCKCARNWLPATRPATLVARGVGPGRDAAKAPLAKSPSIRKSKPVPWAGQVSPRKRMRIILPDEPKPLLDPALIAQFALLIVVVNIAACLLAGRVMTLPEREPQAAARATGGTERPAALVAGQAALPRAASMLPGHPGRDVDTFAAGKRAAKPVSGNRD